MRRSPAGFAHIFILVALVIAGAITSVIGTRHFTLPETRSIQDPAGPPWPQLPRGLSRSTAIRAGDVLAVRVAGEDDLSGEFRVDEGGSITLPMGGAVAVTGLDASDAARRVAAMLADGFLAHPDVAITRVKSDTQSVFVIGEVSDPGVVTLTGDVSLGRAMTLAGGARGAVSRTVLVMRAATPSTAPTAIDAPGARALTFDIDTDAGAPLQDGDTIYVRSGGMIAVMGEVQNPGLYMFEPDLTAARAIALAGGLREGASAKRSQLSRFVNGERRTMNVDPAAVLTPGDILTVRGRRLFF